MSLGEEEQAEPVSREMRWMSTLGRGSLIQMGQSNHAQAAEMVLTGTMLPGRGLTCTKSWALGEEFSTMRFTILMRVSLSLICSREGMDDSHSDPRLGAPPHSCACLQDTGEDSSSRASRAYAWSHPSLVPY